VAAGRSCSGRPEVRKRSGGAVLLHGEGRRGSEAAAQLHDRGVARAERATERNEGGGGVGSEGWSPTVVGWEEGREKTGCSVTKLECEETPTLIQGWVSVI
jgi:hypothetical protein